MAKKRKKRSKKTSKRTKRAGRPKAGSGVNKSQAIRDYLSANPGAKPKDVAAALTAKGIDVAPAFVSVVKSKSRGGKRRRGKKTAAGPRKAASSAALTVDQLVAAKKFIDSAGGVARAKAAIEAVERVLA